MQKSSILILFMIALTISIPVAYAVETWIGEDCTTLRSLGMIPICIDINNLNDKITALETALIPIDTIPTGTIHTFAGLNNAIPDGYLRADGSEISRVEYSELFEIIGTTWGIGNNSTTFNLPDLETDNLFLRAADNDSEVAQTGGQSNVKLTIAEMPSHTHIQNSHKHNVQQTYRIGGDGSNPRGNFVYLQEYANSGHLGTHNEQRNLDASITSTTPTNQNTGGRDSHENKPPYVSIYFIIKT